MLKLMDTLFIMSLKGSVLVILILLIKTTFKNRLNTKFHYYIWFLLIVKLIIPYGPESSFSVFNIFNPIMEKKIIYNNDNFKIPKVPSSINTVKNVETVRTVKLDDTKNTPALSKKINYENILLYIWLSGIIVLIASILLSIRKIEIIKKAAVSRELPNFNRILNDYIKVMNVREKVLLRYTDKIDSPCLYGLIKPVIFIPINTAERISEDEFKYIIIHELSHLKRKDILIKWITIILNIIYWFNPVIRYGFYKMSDDCEVSCDDYALKYLNNNENIDYGNAIIKVLELGHKRNALIATTSMIINKSEIKRRIIMISKYKRVSMKSIICGVLVIITAAAVGLTSNISKVKANDKSKGIISNTTKVLSDKITFKDKNLEAVVRAKINKPNGDILKSDTAKIEELSVNYTTIKDARMNYLKENISEDEYMKNYKELASLEGLEYFTNIKSLNLALSFADDISPLKNLTNLKNLNISRNYRMKNKDISTLSGLINLENLDISSNGIKDLSPLKNMKKLKVLNLYSDAVTDLSPIKNLIQIEEINLSGSSRDGYNSVKDISILKSFKNLKKLDISYNPINKKSIDDLKKSVPNCYIVNDNAKEDYIISTDFEMKELDFKGYEKRYSGNFEKNIYSAQFETFNGTELYEIKASKPTYNMKISSNIKSGNLAIKVYDGEKVLFEKNNPVNETITISNKLAGSISLECVGKKANGSFKIDLN